MRFKTQVKIALALLLAGPVASAQDDMTWRQVDSQNLVFIGMREGEIVLELNPVFAPQTVQRFKELIRDDFYRGMSFYRVIDGFVAQAGPGEDIVLGEEDMLPPEFEIERDPDLPWAQVQRDDLFAKETGFIDGFPAARDRKSVWLTHCPGAVAMARGNAPDSGAKDFYIVIGQAPRYLDRNLTVFARVIDGMETVQQVRRGDTLENGIVESEMARSRISRMRLYDQLEKEERRDFYVMDTSSLGFASLMMERRNRNQEFFVKRPPGVLDVCQVPVLTRVEQPASITRQVLE